MFLRARDQLLATRLGVVEGNGIVALVFKQANKLLKKSLVVVS